MITATDLELRAGSRILLSGAEPARAVRRPDRPRRAQRRREDDDDARARRRGRALRRVARPHQRRRLPAAGSPRGRPHGHRQGPGALRPRPRRAAARDGEGAVGDGRARRRRRRTSGPCATTGASRSGSPRSAATPRRARRPGSARTSGCPTACCTSRWPRSPAASAGASSWPASCSRPPTAAGGRAERHDAAARRADQPPRRRLDHLAALVPGRARRRAGRDQPRHRAARRGGQQGVVPRRDPQRGRRLQHGLAALPRARATDEKRRRRERANAEKKAAALHAAGGQDGRQGDQGRRREEHGAPGRRLLAGLEPSPQDRQGGADPLPGARPVRPDPADRGGPVQGVRLAGGLHRRRPRRRPRQPRSSCSGSTARARPPCCGCWPAPSTPDTGAVVPRPRAADRLLRAGARHARPRRRPSGTTSGTPSPDTPEQQLRTLLGAFMFSGEQLDQPAGTLSGGEKTRLALAGLVSSAANVLLLDEPTNNLDPASREQVLDALRRYQRRRRAGDARPRRGGGARARTGHPAARRHRGSLVRRTISNWSSSPDRAPVAVDSAG